MRFITLLLLFAGFNTLAQTNIENLKKKFLSSGDTLSYYLKDQQGNIRAYNPDEALIPASVFKIYSAYYILKKLGTDFRFKTSLAYNGSIKNGKLIGDLVLETSGDPYLLTAQALDLVESLREFGIKEVTGNLIIVNDFVDIVRIGNVGLEDQPYNQSISGFNLNFNRFKSVGRTNREIFPIHDGLKTQESKSSLGPGLVFKNNPNSTIEDWTYAKKSQDYYLEVPLRNSLVFNANYFRNFLNGYGVSTSGIVFKNKAQRTKLINSVYSPNSLDLVKLALEYSNNLFIETLVLKASGRKSLKEAAAFMAKDLKIKYSGELENSSGLSVELKLKAKDIVEFIETHAYKKFAHHYFINLFSITGHSGSLYKKYLTKQGFEKYRYKTGSVDFVYNICGRSFEKNQKTFCVMINNPKKRKLLMGKNSVKNEKLRQDAKAWRRSMERFSELLLQEL